MSEDGTAGGGRPPGGESAPGGGFVIEHGQVGDTRVLRLRGELDLLAAPVLRRGLVEAAQAHVPRLLVDVSELGFVDSTGLSVLVAARHRLAEAGGRLALAGPGGVVRDALVASGLDLVIDVYGGLDEALAALGEELPPPRSQAPS
ncbi:MAG TPA: STAS domain-containing protein [Acidimicrobiales bacterium]|nr:STAS domain-containing protein [Acidimicrobiales bacterium]